MKTAIYPGTFDPITNGHLDVIKRGLKIFDHIVVALSPNPAKSPLFSEEQRLQMLQIATQGLPVSIKTFHGLLAEFAEQQGIFTIIRGLRAVSDFEYELQMHYANASLSERLETVYLMPSLQRAFVSSSIVRTIFCHGADASHLVPAGVWALMCRLREQKEVLCDM